MNKCILVGNLTRDPETTTTQSGITMCRFSIAVNRPYSNAQGEREADFINIITWRGLAENCGRFLTKGKKVAICGAIQTRSYNDNDGNKRYTTEVVADDVEFLSPRGEGGENYAPQAPSSSGGGKKQISELEPVADEDLPF